MTPTDTLQVVPAKVVGLVTLVIELNLVVGLELDHAGGASLVLRLLPPLLEPLGLRLHEVQIFRGNTHHRRLIALPGVLLPEDDAGLPLRRAGLNGHLRPDELRIHPRLDLREV